MKFTLSWLKDHLETDASLDEIAEKLTSIGLEVEGVEDPAAALKPFIVAHVDDAWQHPNADRLRVCMVNDGTSVTQVICGAPNARKGMKGVFAPAGSYVPGTDLLLKAGEIRGESSNGMLCSERELGLSDEHDGIIDLPDDAPVGTAFAEYRGLNDPVIEIGITPNRADCLGIYGIARDLAAAGLGTLKSPDLSTPEGSYEPPMVWKIEPDIGIDVPYTAGRHFRNVKNGPSPEWMQTRLKAIGLRPISALVDITNYVTYDLGRPLHVFDADKVKGNPTMRYAREGESLLALDGKDYSLDTDMVVIADNNGPESLGGIMGGELSGCTEETTSVFLEAALFNPIKVAETGRKLGVNSDARYRFERGVDPHSADWGVDVGARLIIELCGGEVSTKTAAGEVPGWDRQVDLRMPRLKRHSGIDVPVEEADAILQSLGFKTSVNGDTIAAQVPTWRRDVETEFCLIEEVLRIHGFDRVPAVPLTPATPLPPAAISLEQRRVAYAKKILAQRGMLEAVTWSFMAGDLAQKFAKPDQFDRAEMTLANPISSELDVMRPSILPNLVQAAVRNADRGMPDLALFEVGPVFRNSTDKGQDTVAAGIRSGSTGTRHWDEKPRAVDAFDAKADALAVLEACGAPVANLQTSDDAPAWYHPGRSGQLRLGPNVLAAFGELHPGIGKELGLKSRAAVFEIFVENVPVPRVKGGAKAGGKARPLLKTASLLPLNRDFAFVVDEGVAADQLVKAVVSADKKMVKAAQIFDVYRGAELDGKKSVAIAVTIQPAEKTLTDEEIDAIGATIIANVAKQTGGALR